MAIAAPRQIADIWALVALGVVLTIAAVTDVRSGKIYNWLTYPAVGVALVVAMLVTPAASAYLLVRRLPAMMAISASIGALSGVVGVYASYYWSVAAGPAVVLVCTGIFVATLLLSPRKGLIGAGIERWASRKEPSQ